VDASGDKGDKEETTCMQAETRSLQNPSVTRISLQFPLNRNTLAPCHRHGEKQKEEEREIKTQQENDEHLQKRQAFFPPFPSSFFSSSPAGFRYCPQRQRVFHKEKNLLFPSCEPARKLSHRDGKPKKHS